MKLAGLFLILVVIGSLGTEAYTFSRCELVRSLRYHGLPENKLRDWVCLVEKESSRRTDAIGMQNSDGSWDHGLFQINDRYWCNRAGWPGKECNVSCDQLRSNDITEAVRCAKKIFARHGFSAWVAWRSYCQYNLPDISYC
ncbi:unnamed protein product [Colias eurytheme]|nr:unnamed protein product [Colias eurytheme]